MAIPLRITVLAATLALTGCGGTIINPYYGGNFEPTEAHNVKVLVSGEPVANSKTDVSQAVIAAMQGHTAYPTDFSLLPPGTTAPYRTIVLFNPPPGVSTWALCDQPLRVQAMPAPVAAAGRMEFSAALCRGERILSGAYGYTDRAPPDDPRFQIAVAELTRNLFPPQNPDWQLFGGGGGSSRH